MAIKYEYKVAKRYSYQEWELSIEVSVWLGAVRNLDAGLPMNFSNKVLQVPSRLFRIESLGFWDSIGTDVNIHLLHIPNRMEHPRVIRQFEGTEPERIDLN